MKRLILALALVACAVPPSAHAGHCRLFPRLAARTAKPATCSTPVPSRPVVTMANVGRAVVTAPAKVLRAVAGPTCANGVCK